MKEDPELDHDAYQLSDSLRSSFNENFDSRTAQDTADLFEVLLKEYESSAAHNPKDKTLWARNEALKAIAEETDMKFSRTPGNVSDAENKRILGSNSHFKKRYDSIHQRILKKTLKEQDKKLYGDK